MFPILLSYDLFLQSQKKLAVVITSTSPSIKNPLKLKGYYIYLTKGEEIKKEINKNAWGWNFEGDYIKEVKVQKVEGEGSFNLFIIENDEVLFESDSVDTLKPVIYRRDGKEI